MSLGFVEIGSVWDAALGCVWWFWFFFVFSVTCSVEVLPVSVVKLQMGTKLINTTRPVIVNNFLDAFFFFLFF